MINELIWKGLTEWEIREELRHVAGPFIFSGLLTNAKNERPINNYRIYSFGVFSIITLLFTGYI